MPPFFLVLLWAVIGIRYPFIACEVIACEAWGIFESALSNTDVLVKFWEFLDRPPPLNPMQASYFAKVIGVFLMKRTNEVTHWKPMATQDRLVCLVVRCLH